MRNPMRAAFRLALTGWLALAGLSFVATAAQAAAPPEKALPDATVVFGKIENAAAFRDAFQRTQLGQMIADPAMQPLKDDIKAKTANTNAKLKETVGVTIRELIALPQGTVTAAIVAKDDANVPFAIVLTADAGKNAAQMADVLNKATAQGEKTGAKVSKETFKSLNIQVVQPPKPKTAKDGDNPPPPVAWTQVGTTFLISSDVDILKDVLGHVDGRDGGLASGEHFVAAQKKLGLEAHAFWYVDIGKLITLVTKAGAKGKNAARMQDVQGYAQLLGINGLKAVAGNYTMNTGSYDSISKTYIIAPVPLAGLLKLFPMPKVSLKPEPWVPATVASYQTFSWNLDDAFTALNDLANQFQPGVLGVLEQQLVGPNGGEPLSFKKDIFDPLGNRITLVADFKKPITEDSQRMLVGVALSNATAFQNSLTKIIQLAGAAPKKRDFQGTTIYDFQLPDIPNTNPNVNANRLKGPISLAIAKDTLFVSSEATLLEQVLRGGGAALADSAGYQTVAKEIPAQTSTLSFAKPEESARQSYEMIKSGQFQKALSGAAVAGGPDISRLGQLINKDKLPEFSVFAKYLSLGGGYSVMEDDGITFTSFSLRKANP